MKGVVVMATGNWCTFCSFSSVVKKDVLVHMKDCHALEPGFCIKCLRARKFRVYSPFTSNISRFHPGVKLENAFLCDDKPSYEPPSDPVEGDNDDHMPPVKRVDISHCSGTFLAGLKEKHLVFYVYK